MHCRKSIDSAKGCNSHRLTFHPLVTVCSDDEKEEFGNNIRSLLSFTKLDVQERIVQVMCRNVFGRYTLG